MNRYEFLLNERDKYLKEYIPEFLDLPIRSFPRIPKKVWFPRSHLTQMICVNFRRAAIQMSSFRERFNQYPKFDKDYVENADNYVCFCVAMYFFGSAALKGARKLSEEVNQLPKLKDEIREELANYRESYKCWAKDFSDFRSRIGVHGEDPEGGGYEWHSAGRSSGVFTFYTYSMKTLKKDGEFIISPDVDFFKLERYLIELFEILYRAWGIKKNF